MLNIVVSLFPVFAFLGALMMLDSFKLMKLSAVLKAILAGVISALFASLINTALMRLEFVADASYPLYVAPIIEECTKALFVIYLLKRRAIGFMVDAAIYGFAIGAGFAFLENVFYLNTVVSANVFLWILRGFGTAVMHGGTTALFAIITKGLIDRHSSERIHLLVPGLMTAVLVHAFYNHFFFSPQISTAIILVTLPLVFAIVFKQSERATRNWLGIGLDTDVELMEALNNGQFSDSRIGQYLSSLKAHFPGEVVADMLCLVRIHTELSIKAKATLLMREAGFRLPPDNDVQEKFTELRFLEKSIGRTGQLAIMPSLRTSARDLWQLHMLEQG
jgi:RsiW-degrading membrane proteinase PrsW (M82 family)